MLRNPATAQHSKFGHSITIQETMVTDSHSIYCSNLPAFWWAYGRLWRRACGRAQLWLHTVGLWVNGHFRSHLHHPEPPTLTHIRHTVPSGLDLVWIVCIGTLTSRRTITVWQSQGWVWESPTEFLISTGIWVRGTNVSRFISRAHNVSSWKTATVTQGNRLLSLWPQRYSHKDKW